MAEHPRSTAILLALEVLLCIATGFWRLGHLSFWDDEVTSLDFAREAPAEIWRDRDPNNSPFYYELLHVWRGIIGEEEVALRSLSAGSRVLGLLAVFWMASVMLDPRRALIAGLLYVMSPAALLYGREVRAYPLLLAACAAAMASLWLAHERRSFRWACASGCFFAIALMMHYSTLFVIVGLATVHFVPPLKKGWIFFGVSVLVMGMTVLPWVEVFVENMQNLIGAATGHEQVPVPFGPPGKMAYALFVLVLGETVLPWRWIIVLPAALASAILGVQGIRRLRGDLCLLLVVPVALAVIGLSSTMKAGPRYVFLLLPLLLLLFSAGVQGLAGRVALGIILACESISLTNLYLGREYHNEAYVEPTREVADFLAFAVNPEDALVYTTYPKPLLYYVKRPPEPQFLGYSRFRYVDLVFPRRATTWVVERSPGRTPQSGWIAEEVEQLRANLESSYGKPTEWRFGHDPDAAEKEKWIGKPFLRDRIVILKYEAK